MWAKRLLLWLPPLGIAVCTLAMPLRLLSVRCAFAPWLCNDRGLPMDVLTMARAPLVLLLLLTAGGVGVGGVQWWRTRQALHRLHRVPAQDFPESLADLIRQLGIQERFDLVRGTVPTAFCAGLLRPRVCVTTALYDLLAQEEVEAVLRHERYHLQRRDPLRTLLWTILDQTCWWLEAGGQHALYQRELAADRAVIAEQGQRPLARALFTLLAHAANEDVPLAGLAISGLSVSDARIDQLLQRAPALPPAVQWNRWSVLPLATIVITLVCSFMTS